MSITYAVDEALGVVREVWVGEIHPEEVRAHWARMLTDPAALAVRRSFSDLREARFRFTGAELDELIRAEILPRLGDGGWRSAMVVSRPAQLGVSRQFQVFASTFSRDSVFYDLDEALAWLLGDAPPGAGGA